MARQKFGGPATKNYAKWSKKSESASSRKRANIKNGSSARVKAGKVPGNKEATEKISEVMSKFRKSRLHAGKTGTTVTSPKQAKAIALAEAQWQAHKDRAGGSKAAAAENHRKQKGGSVKINRSSRKQAGGYVTIKRG